eukprot:1131844-Rhodomonas_salina.2
MVRGAEERERSRRGGKGDKSKAHAPQLRRVGGSTAREPPGINTPTSQVRVSPEQQNQKHALTATHKD